MTTNGTHPQLPLTCPCSNRMPVTDNAHAGFIVACPGCAARTVPRPTLTAAIAAWNAMVRCIRGEDPCAT